MEQLLKEKIQSLGLIYVPIPEESVELIYRLFVEDRIEGIPNSENEHLYFGSYHKHVAHDYDQMKHHYLLATKQGNRDAMYSLAGYYHDTEKDYDAMKVYYRMAIELGCVKSMTDLAHYYLYKEKNYELMKVYCQMAIKLGSSKAMNILGDYYQDVEINESLMMLNYHLAIELGNATSMNNLGYYYSTKKPACREDQQLTIKYYQMAVEKGNVHAMGNLAQYYHQLGNRTVLMKKYYQLAIQTGNDKSIMELGEYYMAQAGSEEAFEFGLAHQIPTLVKKNYREEYVHRLPLIPKKHLTEAQLTAKQEYLVFLWETLQDVPTYFSSSHCVKDVLEMIKAYL